MDAPTQHAPQSLSIPMTTRQAITDLPLATSPTSYHSRQALPAPEKRSQDDTIAEGSTAKQARTATETTRERPGTEEPSPTRRRVNNITIKTAKGDTITTASSEGHSRARQHQQDPSRTLSSMTTKATMRTN